MGGRIALITGATRGIGKAILEHFLQLNYIVIGTATTESGIENIKEHIALSKSQGYAYLLNLNDPKQIESFMQDVTTNVGAPEIIVNNAGITKDNLFLLLKSDDFDSVIKTNLYGIFNVIKAGIKPMLKAQWGRIINVTSVVAHTGNPGQTNYCAAKAGIIGFSKSLAREIAKRNITVNMVAPGFIATDMTANLQPEQQQKLLANIPMGRMGLAKEVAAAVAFLASEDAGYITGESIHVNGGMLMN